MPFVIRHKPNPPAAQQRESRPPWLWSGQWWFPGGKAVCPYCQSPNIQQEQAFYWHCQECGAEGTRVDGLIKGALILAVLIPLFIFGWVPFFEFVVSVCDRIFGAF